MISKKHPPLIPSLNNLLSPLKMKISRIPIRRGVGRIKGTVRQIITDRTMTEIRLEGMRIEMEMVIEGIAGQKVDLGLSLWSHGRRIRSI
jgi:hypothetical protein